jgi:hypothetical protein
MRLDTVRTIPDASNIHQGFRVHDAQGGYPKRYPENAADKKGPGATPRDGPAHGIEGLYLPNDGANHHQYRGNHGVYDIEPETQGRQASLEPGEASDKPATQGSHNDDRTGVHFLPPKS